VPTIVLLLLLLLLLLRSFRCRNDLCRHMAHKFDECRQAAFCFMICPRYLLPALLLCRLTLMCSRYMAIKFGDMGSTTSTAWPSLLCCCPGFATQAVVARLLACATTRPTLQ
jgi:hypothetical protein